MSLLFPLYALGALALAAPLIFHLFQRKPHGQQEFSSLMFLQSTPPKLTRRSRLSDLFLLLLRGLALLALAAAFARPFLRSADFLNVDAPSRSVALIVDTSASMRRTGVWEEVQTSIDRVVNELRPTDQVTLISFDRKPTTLHSFEAWEDTDASQRLALLKEQISGLEPTWFATDLSSATIEAADALLQQRLVEDHIQPLQAIVFTDLQEGSDLAGLRAYQWPEDVSVDIKTVTPKMTTNASIQALPPDASEMDSTQVRVLVRNEGDSDRGQFQLKWVAPNASPIDVYVPPGQTRVVRVTQPTGAEQLTLTGDEHDFDNQLFITATERSQKELWYLGDDDGTDAQSLFYYLGQSSLDTRVREVAVKRIENAQMLATVLPKQCPLIVAGKPLEGSAADDALRYVRRGGRLLVVLQSKDRGVDSRKMTTFLSKLLERPDVQLIESDAADSRRYAMLAKIDFQHPVFQPFADPRYNDFTKIQFWSHRQLTCSEDPPALDTNANDEDRNASSEGNHENAETPPWTEVAQFDNGSPALVEKKLGDGTVWILTAGWQPIESSLALSSKFVPLLHGFFGSTNERVTRIASRHVGESIDITPSEDATMIVAPTGQIFDLEPLTTKFEDADVTGIYEVQQGDRKFSMAVNLSPNECRTKPLMPDQLEQLGLKLGKQKSVAVMESEQRQMRSKELEGKQKLWRWGILAALVAVALETWLGGRARQPVVA